MWSDQNKEKTSVKPKINNEFWQWEKQKSKFILVGTH